MMMIMIIIIIIIIIVVVTSLLLRDSEIKLLFIHPWPLVDSWRSIASESNYHLF